ncbi:MAG: hypothetical protein AAB434_01470, partial [Planctomycetota bacterium]
RGRDEAARSAERRLAPPPTPEEPRRAETPAPPASSALKGVPVRRTDTAPAPAPPPSDTAPAPRAADAYQDDGRNPAAPKVRTDPSAHAEGDQDAGPSQMLAVLFTNPAYRGKMVEQMVAEVAKRVTFSDTQLEAAKKELEAALQPLVEAFQKGPVEMKDLDPRFQVVKEDWKRRLTPLLTAEQGLAFQGWLDEKHSLKIKMGMDEKGDPVDPDEHEDK